MENTTNNGHVTENLDFEQTRGESAVDEYGRTAEVLARIEKLSDQMTGYRTIAHLLDGLIVDSSRVQLHSTWNSETKKNVEDGKLSINLSLYENQGSRNVYAGDL